MVAEPIGSRVNLLVGIGYGTDRLVGFVWAILAYEFFKIAH